MSFLSRFHLLAAMLVPGIPVLAQPAPDYSGYTVARFIPFVAPMRPASSPARYRAPELRFSIQGKSYTAIMDTGSTGVALSATSIPGYKPSTACQNPGSFPGWEFLSSSGLLWVGHWVPQEIHFRDSQGGTVIASVPVLAVECEAVCRGYNGGPQCSDGGPLVPAKPTIHYLGVGFGREIDGQPQGTPDKNPLLNITAIAGKPVAPRSMDSGYILTARGVHVGLTPANTSGFAYTKLTCPKPPGDTRNCSQAPGCVTVDGSECAPGSGLVDTGISQMYLSVPPSVTVRAQVVPDPSNKSVKICALQNGSRVTVRFGSPKPIAFYSFTVGPSPAQTTQPPLVLLPSSTGGVPPACTPPSKAQDQLPFVNTGGNFLQGFDVLFDAGGGYFGLRWKGPAGSPQGGLGPGPQTAPQG